MTVQRQNGSPGILTNRDLEFEQGMSFVNNLSSFHGLRRQFL